MGQKNKIFWLPQLGIVGSSQCNSTRTKERIEENVRTKNCWPLFALLNYFIASTYVRRVLDERLYMYYLSQVFFSWPDANESVWDLTRIWSSTFYDLVDGGCQSAAAACSCYSTGVNAIQKLLLHNVYIPPFYVSHLENIFICFELLSIIESFLVGCTIFIIPGWWPLDTLFKF